MSWRAGLALGLLHTLVDTRIPLGWWIRAFKHSEGAPEASSIAMWTDQALHIALIAFWIEVVYS